MTKKTQGFFLLVLLLFASCCPRGSQLRFCITVRSKEIMPLLTEIQVEYEGSLGVHRLKESRWSGGEEEKEYHFRDLRVYYKPFETTVCAGEFAHGSHLVRLSWDNLQKEWSFFVPFRDLICRQIEPASILAVYP